LELALLLSAGSKLQKLDVLGVALSVFQDSFHRRTWEQEYGVARRHEIETKQNLVDAYRQLLPALNAAYLPNPYPKT
jgi:hypothetical protein